MRESSKYIILTGVFTGCLSSLYFFSLLFHIPFVVTAILAGVVLLLLCRLLFKDKQPMTRYAPGNKKQEYIALGILVAGMILMANNSFYYSMKYGGWDASGIWNFHAEYLADENNWRKLFQNVEYSHADYPLCLPAVIAFFMRLCRTHETIVIPFVFSTLITICISVLIYMETSGKNLVAAISVLLLFVFETYYYKVGVSQYADIVLAFFFLCAFVCINYMEQDKKYLVLAAFFLASCAWTKNEGAILAIIFMGFYGRVFFSRKNIKYTAIGLAIPFVTLLTFKLICPIQNDLVSETNSSVLSLLAEKDRYVAIWNSYANNIMSSFLFTTIGICIYAIICMAKKKLPGRQALILLSCLFVYSMLYVITPKDINWHLVTSQSRLMMQLMPALVYVMASHVAGMEFKLPVLKGIKEAE